MGIKIGYAFENHNCAVELMQIMCDLIFGVEICEFSEGFHKFQSVFMHIITRKPEFTFLQLINILQHPDVNRLDVVDVIVSLLEHKLSNEKGNDTHTDGNSVSVHIGGHDKVFFSNEDRSGDNESYTSMEELLVNIDAEQ